MNYEDIEKLEFDEFLAWNDSVTPEIAEGYADHLLAQFPQKPIKTFRDYYADPEFRARHLKYMSQKVKCTCGFITGRANLSRHKKSSNHLNRMKDDKLFNERYDKYRDEIQQKIELDVLNQLRKIPI